MSKSFHEANIMSSLTSTSDLIHRSFLTALLLVGTPDGAEVAVQASIQLLRDDCGLEINEQLLRGSVVAALQLNRSAKEDHGRNETVAGSRLPQELQRVLVLPSGLRESFVTYILLGMARESCADLLDLDFDVIKQRARQAMQELARPAES
jgi:DNA-directed RNA polymerase specialized sigma24 family protein